MAKTCSNIQYHFQTKVSGAEQCTSNHSKVYSLGCKQNSIYNGTFLESKTCIWTKPLSDHTQEAAVLFYVFRVLNKIHNTIAANFIYLLQRLFSRYHNIPVTSSFYLFIYVFFFFFFFCWGGGGEQHNKRSYICTSSLYGLFRQTTT